MNGLLTPPARRQAVSNLYSEIKNGNPSRDISLDEHGVVAFCGSQGTNHVWFGERIARDEETATYRVLKLEPTKSKGVQPNQRTKIPEFGTRLSNVRYVVGDVSIPRFKENATLGRVLREVQGKFRHIQRSRPIESGNVHGDNEVASVYNRLFVTRGGDA